MEDSVGGTLQRDALIGLNCYWRQKRYAFDASSNLIYMGFHYMSQAGTDDGNWAIQKFTYTGSDVTLIEGPLIGAWDDRTTLDWL